MTTTTQLLYLEFSELWKSLCDIHHQLYQVTADEYIALLNSNLDQVHALLETKEALMKKIEMLNQERVELVNKVAKKANLSYNEANKFKTVYDYLRTELGLNEDNPLLKYHQLMIDLVEKTQDQNKKNRLFLNKALHSIQELKKEFNGTTKVNTYSRTGEKQVHCR